MRAWRVGSGLAGVTHICAAELSEGVVEGGRHLGSVIDSDH